LLFVYTVYTFTLMITTITTGRKYFTDDYCVAMSFAKFYDADVIYADGGYFIVIPK
jgi:hypothetical protein